MLSSDIQHLKNILRNNFRKIEVKIIETKSYTVCKQTKTFFNIFILLYFKIFKTKYIAKVN